MPAELEAERVDNSPQPIVNKAIPAIINGVKYPISVTAAPPHIEAITTDSKSGRI